MTTITDRRLDSSTLEAILPAELGRGVKMPIFLTDVLFMFPSEQAAKNMIKFHAFKHAEDYFLGIDFGGGVRLDHRNVHLFKPETVECIWELRGNDALLKGVLPQQKPPNDFTFSFTSALSETRKFHHKLSGVSPISDLEGRVIEGALRYHGMLIQQ